MINCKSCLFNYSKNGCSFACGITNQSNFEDSFITKESLYNAYLRCRRRKRKTINALKFEENLEENLTELYEEIISDRYMPKRSVVFLAEKPKKREIFAADFRDRIVHHLLVGYWESDWEKRFIYDSYACRKNKGLHKAVEKTQNFMRKITNNNTQGGFFLQLDIKGFFMNINKEILFDILAKKEQNPVVLNLARKIIFNDSVSNCVFKKCSIEQCLSLPKGKSLFHSEDDCGLPIGNLTSQFFANVYMDVLDQFIKHKLKCKYYLRYCDDFVLMDADKNVLKSWLCKIKVFLRESLCLELNEKMKIASVSTGLNFLGYIIRPSHLLVRNRVVNNLKDKLKQSQVVYCNTQRQLQPIGGGIRFDFNEIEKMQCYLSSYMGHFKKACSHKLKQSIGFKNSWLYDWFDKDNFAPRFSVPRKSFSFIEQLRYYRRVFPDRWIFIQLGNKWISLPSYQYEFLEKTSGIPKKVISVQLNYIKNLLSNLGVSTVWIKQDLRYNGFIYERSVEDIIL